MTQKDTRQTPHHRCSIAEPLSQYDVGSAPPRNFGSRSTKGPGKTCKKIEYQNLDDEFYVTFIDLVFLTFRILFFEITILLVFQTEVIYCPEQFILLIQSGFRNEFNHFSTLHNTYRK